MFKLLGKIGQFDFFLGIPAEKCQKMMDFYDF